MNQKELKENLNKMKLTVKYLESCVNNNFNVKQHYDTGRINPIVIRNVSYINAIIERVNENIDYINNLDKTKDENKILIKKKAIINIILLKHLCNLSKKYNIEKNDYEIENLLAHTGIPSFVSDITKKLKYKNINIEDEIKDEFETVKKNNKVIEGFNLSSIGNFFKKIGQGFKKVIMGIAKIGKFLGVFLFKFIKFLWMILKFIFKLVTKIIPKIIKSIFNFIRLLIIKFFRVGFFCFILLAVMILAFYKYWQFLMELPFVPMTLIFPPAVILVLYLFWYQTKALQQIQSALIRGIIFLISGTFKYFFAFILGLDRKDRFFRYRGRNVLVKSKLFFMMILKRLPFMITRFFIALLALKFMIKWGAPRIIKQIPSFRELLLFFPIAIRYMYTFLFKILKYFTRKG